MIRDNNYVRILTLALFIFLFSQNCGDSKNSEENYKLGLIEYNKKNLEKAETFFNEALDKDKENIALYIVLGKTYYFMGKFEESINVLKSGLDKFPENSTLNFWLARNYMLYKKHEDEAYMLFVRILEIDDSHFESYYYLGKLQESKGQIKEALINYNRAKLIKYNFDKIHKDLGNLYDKSGLKDRAKEELDSVIRKK
jgi:tetratricopeptide (TPR) repeat protein